MSNTITLPDGRQVDVLTEQDLIIGEKYVPVRKSVYGELDASLIWNLAKYKNPKNPFLFFLGKDEDGDFLFEEVEESDYADFFLPSDMVRYEEYYNLK